MKMSFMIYCIRGIYYSFITLVLKEECAADDSNARLGLANSEHVVCQITSDAFINNLFFLMIQLLAVHNRALD